MISTKSCEVDVACFIIIQRSPHFLYCFFSRLVERLPQIGDKCEPVDSTLVSKSFLERLPLKFLEKDSILI